MSDDKVLEWLYRNATLSRDLELYQQRDLFEAAANRIEQLEADLARVTQERDEMASLISARSRIVRQSARFVQHDHDVWLEVTEAAAREVGDG